MKDKNITIFIIISILLLVLILFSLLLASFVGIDFGSDNEVSVLNQTSDGMVGSSLRDPLMTQAVEIYAATIRTNDPLRGDRDASLYILEFGDFECPYCSSMNQVLISVLADYEGEVSLVWKDFPNPSHLQARTAALAARCAGKQGKFWQYHDMLFENQDDLSRELYNQIALELDLKLDDFNQCLEGKEFISEVGQGLVDGQGLEVNATPYLFIGNSRIDMAISAAELKRIIDLELLKLRR